MLYFQGTCGYCEQVVEIYENWTVSEMNSKPCEFGVHPLPCNSLVEEIEMWV
ncbi:hypothetical protein STRDD10_01391 [Streptococcus sp. DD10]|nr:hypothetical protein STRDD10_01391 [Streptococcus sp. DD10]